VVKTRSGGDPELQRRLMLNFLTNLAHELRTPLVTIRGYSRLLIEGGAGELTPPQRSHLQNVLRDANELVILTDALTSVSRFETLHPAALDFRSLLADWVHSVGASLPGTRLVLGPEPAAPILLLGDRTELRRAVESIVRSIAEGTDSRDEIHIDFDGANQGKRFSIRIHRGNGGAAGAGAPTTDRPAPEGASLSAARELIRLHGGRLQWRGSDDGTVEAFLSFPRALA
jgi:signal transduction histidine kinase